LAQLLRLPAEQLFLRELEIADRLEALSDAGRSAVAPRLLELLDGTGLPQGSLRSRLVEQVLRCGYPWALHLDPDDIARLRLARVGTPPRSWLPVVVTLVLVLLGAAASVALFGDWQRLLPEAPASTAPAKPAAGVAARVAGLREAGRVKEAEALAEACAVALEAPRGCLRQLEDLARVAASESGDAFEVYRSRQFAELAEGPDNATVRERARAILTNEFAREAALLAPSVEGAQVQLLEFIERAVELEAAGDARTLLAESAGCSLRRGQFGLVCRNFHGRAQAMSEPGVVSSPLTEDTAQTRAITHLRRMIEANLGDRVDDEIAHGELCALSAEPESASCRTLLIDAYQRRARSGASPEAVQRDLKAAERLRAHVTGVPRSPRR
jgi:hypothetical protein